MSGDAGEIGAAYFRAWRARDWTTLRSLLADDASFRGPLGSADDAEASAHVGRRAAPSANWSHVESGKITRIRVTFDARPLAPPVSSR